MGLLAVHQILFRIAWLFKTESVIVPGFLDFIAGANAGVFRGFLPILSRVGQGVVPLFFTGAVERLPRKKFLLGIITVSLGLPFLIAGWLHPKASEGTPYAAIIFLGLYFLFAALNGLYLVLFGTIQGKLIHAERRGKLLTLSTFWGTIPAVAAALIFLPRWLDAAGPNYTAVFAAAAGIFAISGFVVPALAEPKSPSRHEPATRSLAVDVLWQTVRSDAALRRLMLVTVLFSVTFVLIPHYQALARQAWGLGGSDRVVWIVVQSISVGLLSTLVGPTADRRGNRLTLRLLIFGAAAAPMFAVLLTWLPGSIAARAFWLVFIPLGIPPLGLRVGFNYALELAPPEHHPRYLAAVQLALLAPLFLSPLVGWAVDQWGFVPVFSLAILVILAAGAATFTLHEPRYGDGSDRKPALIDES
ncbi:hypothetical protein JCM19992_09630 [Thermostilla marina]